MWLCPLRLSCRIPAQDACCCFVSQPTTPHIIISNTITHGLRVCQCNLRSWPSTTYCQRNGNKCPTSTPLNRVGAMRRNDVVEKMGRKICCCKKTRGTLYRANDQKWIPIYLLFAARFCYLSDDCLLATGTCLGIAHELFFALKKRPTVPCL